VTSSDRGESLERVEEKGATVDAAELVWYVSYGSNLNRARFMAYLHGGRIAGNEVVHEGCADASPPVDDVALELPNSLYFAGWSGRVWGGTSAGFITLDPQAPSALARAYLITRGQFLDVVRQENANLADVDDFDLTVARSRRSGHARLLPTGSYSELVYCGEREGHPLLSFTASANRKDFRSPSAAYVRVIASGLQECHGLSTKQVVEYLGDTPGVQGQWAPGALTDMLRTTRPPGSAPSRST
jgi:hypothetical protein